MQKKTLTVIKCTGLKCPMQAGKVDPATCKASGTCKWATKPLTNADRIRAMTDEELARYLIVDVEAEAIRRAGRYLTQGDIEQAVRDCADWLKQEVSE